MTVARKPLAVIADLSLHGASGEAITVTADGAVVTLTLPKLRVNRAAMNPLVGRRRRVALLSRLHCALQIADLTLHVRLRDTLLAQVAPQSRPTRLSRLLGLGPMQIRPWAVLSTLLRRRQVRRRGDLIA